VTVLIFDIDHFKSINDRFGHPAGDEILKLFATVVVNTLRISDLSGRIGGEEFAALLPCSLEEGVIAAERVREAFARSIRPNAAAVIASRRPRNCHCRWKTGGERPPAPRVNRSSGRVLPVLRKIDQAG
jgi:diguanylate cyclase (GGDEF)-like protein